MKKILLLVVTALIAGSNAEAQFTRYLVKLRNKGGNPFSLSNPSAYLSQRAIDRRTRYGIPLDSTDLPVTPSYVTQIRNVANVTVLNVSKWLNSVSIQTTDPNAISTISSFAFVQSVTGFAARAPETPRNKFKSEDWLLATGNRPGEIAADYYNYGTAAYNEIRLHNGEFLHNIGLRGQGMRIAMLDAGFTGYASFRAFDSMNAEGRVHETWDFVSRHADVNDHSHGMQCLSTIVANIPAQFVGKAPKASFYLYRTEDAPTEYPIEEHNWSCGAERADSAGAEIISTSLGYTTFDNSSLNHTYADMNGNTTMAAIAADLAAKKGMLVFASVGNDGNGSWRFLSTPSDGDSVIAVGAVNSAGAVGSFSSYGPSSDGQIKPDVASVGVSAVIQTAGNTIGMSNGTSFACPNMAGLATCLWQGFPEFNNMRIRQALWASGSRASNPDDRVGYGIPNMRLAFSMLLADFATVTASISSCSVTLNWTSKDVGAMKYEIERRVPGNPNYVRITELNAQPGDLLAVRSYQLVNGLNGVANGTVSYRIRQIVDTAAATFTAVYIDSVNVTVSGCVATNTGDPNAAAELVRLAPNPTSAASVIMTVQTQHALPNMQVRIYDLKGRLVQKLQLSKGPGKTDFTLNIGQLAKGRYVVRVFDKAKLVGQASLLRL
ncbi:MAG TPA: S8 family serine peptidase [Chitinophagaceae bacterium]|nr:S8 family serine peptidase [Chitinophagaceae bacterium]